MACRCASATAPPAVNHGWITATVTTNTAAPNHYRLSPDPVDVSGINGSNFNRYWYAANNPMKYRDPDGEFIQAVGVIITGAVIGVAVDVAAQQIVNGFGSKIDATSLYVSAGVGAATGGVGAIYAQSLKVGAITATQAITRTAAVNGAIGAAGSATDSVAHGEQPSAGKMAVAGAMGMNFAQLQEKHSMRRRLNLKRCQVPD